MAWLAGLKVNIQHLEWSSFVSSLCVLLSFYAFVWVSFTLSRFFQTTFPILYIYIYFPHTLFLSIYLSVCSYLSIYLSIYLSQCCISGWGRGNVTTLIYKDINSVFIYESRGEISYVCVCV